jgi:diaminopimelate epimerase
VSFSSPGGESIEFLKLQSCGKDVILIDGTRQPPPERFAALCRRLLHRRFGVGASEAAVLLEAAGGRARAEIIGRWGEPSGFPSDALRCLARYAYDAGLLEGEGADIVVGERSFTADLIDSQSIMMGLGVPRDPENAEIRESLVREPFRTVDVGDAAYTCATLLVEGTQVIVFVPTYAFDLADVSRGLAAELDGPARVGFARVFSRTELQVRTFDETGREEPCSAAASAAALVAAALGGLADREAAVHNRGGDLYVEWEERTGGLYVTGAVSYVFTGTFDAEDVEPGA